ncbi:MAG: glycosyltransferase family 4 protein [Candidatus Bathyarchaeaceae archaeon]
MKEILLINNRSSLTGIGNYGYNLFTYLKQIGQKDLDFITLQSSAEDSYGHAINVFGQKIKRIIDHLKFVRRIPRHYKIYHLLNPNLGILLLRHRPSVVTVHDVAPFIPLASRDMIIQSHGLDVLILMAMQINMRFVRNADRIISMSQHTKNDLVSIFGVNSKIIRVIYPGIDRNLFSPRDQEKARRSLHLPLNREIILHVGVDEPRKNIQTLIKTLYMVRKKFPKTLLIRIGGMRSTTRRLISSLGLDDAILNYQKVANIALFYNAADLFVCPSYYEGFGFPLLEAMASGCPVIAGNSSSIPEVVGKAGILFPPSDVTMLNESICQVLADQNMQSMMIKNGLERSLKFDWNTCARQTLEVYETLYS